MVKKSNLSEDLIEDSLAWTDSISLPVSHIRAIMRTFGPAPEVVGERFAAAGVSDEEWNDPDYMMPLRLAVQMIYSFEQRIGSDWYLTLPILWSVDLHSETGMAMRFARSFASAIDVATEFSHLRWSMRRLISSRSPAGIVLTIMPTVSFPADIWRAILLLTSLNFQTVARAILVEGAQTISYRLPGDPPAFADRVASMLDGPVEWGHDRATIFIPDALLSIVPPMTNGRSFALMLEALREQLVATSQTDVFAPRVRQALASVTRGQLDAAEIGTRIGVSRRTLERRLATEGTSFRALSEDSLKARLISLLSDPNLPTAVIAERLGYQDASSLQRACRRWFGQPLLAMRKLNLGGLPASE